MVKARGVKVEGVSAPSRPPPTFPGKGHPTDNPDIESRLLELAYERKALNLWMQLASAPIAMALVWSFFAPAPLLVWGLAVMLVSLLGLVETGVYRRTTGKVRSVRLWRAVYVGGRIAQGLAWSSGAQ